MGQGNKPALPTDANKRAIEIPYHPVQQINIGPMSNVSVGHMSSTINNPNGIVKIRSTADMYFKLQKASGTGSSVNPAVTDFHLPANTDRDIILRNHNRIAFMPASSAASYVYITLRG